LSEHGLLLALIAVACLTGVTALGTRIGDMFNMI
jgi:Flp pilus assembly pilin Flp